MSREPRWIDRRALLLLHEESLATFGGATGQRDAGLLDSALARLLVVPWSRARTYRAMVARILSPRSGSRRGAGKIGRLVDAASVVGQTV